MARFRGGGGGIIEHKVCDLILLKTFLILRRIQRDIIKNAHRLHVKKQLLLSDFKETNFRDRFSEKNPQTSNSVKIRPVGAGLFNVDGQTDTTKLF
jgi:hypothetical protein